MYDCAFVLACDAMLFCIGKTKECAPSLSAAANLRALIIELKSKFAPLAKQYIFLANRVSLRSSLDTQTHTPHYCFLETLTF